MAGFLSWSRICWMNGFSGQMFEGKSVGRGPDLSARISGQIFWIRIFRNEVRRSQLKNYGLNCRGHPLWVPFHVIHFVRTRFSGFKRWAGLSVWIGIYRIKGLKDFRLQQMVINLKHFCPENQPPPTPPVQAGSLKPSAKVDGNENLHHDIASAA